MLPQLSAAEQIVALGCELISGVNNKRQKRFVILEGTPRKYEKVCVDNINVGAPDPISCWTSIDQDARTIKVDAFRTSAFLLALHRKSSLLLIKDTNGLISDGNVTETPDSISSVEVSVGTYKCAVSPDAQSTLDYIRNAKKNQIDQNKF